MRNLTIPADVAAVIGAQRAARLAAGPYPVDYRCSRCRRRGRIDDGEAVSAGVDVSPQRIRVWFVHPACGPAGVTVLDHDPGDLYESDATGVLYAGVNGGGIAMPCVAIEICMSVEMVDPLDVDAAGDAVDVVLGAVLNKGLQPAADPLTPPEPDGPITWRVQLPGRGRGGGVYGPRRLQLISPLPPIPPHWLDLVAVNHGRCGLFVTSRTGLLAVLDDLGRALMDAGRAGRLVGTTAAVIP